MSLLDPTISAVTITPTKRAAITKISSELWQDRDINLGELVVESTTWAIGFALGTATTATLVAGINDHDLLIPGSSTPIERARRLP